ncbi:hypothetical protein BU23DRAFT_571059 [Bimuria novae-zelandiae CBS 107.79]|uniref:Uncharacterized protein n=1 Tax=Bimuria novae-zelandiae CBS 107.79 TaxID=1447943 RepID=A0A6A5UYV5_9PLEO|nr:hypothetical protein BU23DRAFT_571059 [Bimuria novae-zelandiae CBS 107.79]
MSPYSSVCPTIQHKSQYAEGRNRQLQEVTPKCYCTALCRGLEKLRRNPRFLTPTVDTMCIQIPGRLLYCPCSNRTKVVFCSFSSKHFGKPDTSTKEYEYPPGAYHTPGRTESQATSGNPTDPTGDGLWAQPAAPRRRCRRCCCTCTSILSVTPRSRRQLGVGSTMHPRRRRDRAPHHHTMGSGRRPTAMVLALCLSASGTGFWSACRCTNRVAVFLGPHGPSPIAGLTCGIRPRLIAEHSSERGGLRRHSSPTTAVPTACSSSAL